MNETTLVILGATGDLTQRLLLPGLGSLLKTSPGRRIRILGASIEPTDPGAWNALVTESLVEGGLTAEVAAAVAADSHYEVLNVTDAATWPAFVSALPPGSVLYFALPPAVSVKACELLVGTELPENLTLALEKPFGTDLESARSFNALLARLVPEERIHRIDHFLGKSTVLNLLGLRFANRIFEPIWNATHIESVDIYYDESLALEGRAGYYDHAGALRDMIQSHLLLVMAMEAPSRIDHLEVRDLMAHILRATCLLGGPAEAARRARYTAGTADGQEIVSYVDEDGIDPARGTETLAEICVEIQNSRWAGVPFRLRSGKALGRKAGGIIATFRPVAHLPEGLDGEVPQNVVALGLAQRGIRIRTATNGAHSMHTIETTDLTASLGEGALMPYGEIFAGILDGDPLLSVRRDVVEECWRIVTGVVEAWEAGLVPLEEYPAGSHGPEGWRIPRSPR